MNEKLLAQIVDTFERRILGLETNATYQSVAPLTLDVIFKCMEQCRPNEPVVVGLAISPSVAALIPKDRFTQSFIAMHTYGFDTIIDPRLGDKSEVFYDASAWKIRCSEQHQWDAKKFLPAARV